MKRSTPEGYVLRACLDLLALHRIWHRRQNTGAMVLGEGPTRRFYRSGKAGDADILAIVPRGDCFDILHVECKSKVGKQSPAQKAFEAEVTALGHAYLLAYSSDDLFFWLRDRGRIWG